MNSNGTSWASVFSDSFQSPLIPQLLRQLTLHQCTTFPTALQLNHAASTLTTDKWEGPAFKAQSTFDGADNRYYEQIIAQDTAVPTRENDWHDLFNACIWMQFPKTKWYLNRLHVEDIFHHGLHPRTKRRNHITHFDECGVVLAVPQRHLTDANEVLQHLAFHEWDEAFLKHQSAWGDIIHPRIFGHANYEMLLNPFIGLTGKWIAVIVDDMFEASDLNNQNQLLDEAIKTRIISLEGFAVRSALPPLPLLGVPGWHHTQNSAFYANQEYFRPLRGKPRDEQLPLCNK